MLLAKSASVALSGTVTLMGTSRAGDATCFFIPELRWMFDCGACITGKRPSCLFLTHTHSDHVLYLARLLLDAEKPFDVYLPASVVSLVERHLQAYHELTASESSTKCSLIGLEPKAEITIGNNIVRTIECRHRVVCLGYSVWKKSSKLKPEYQGKPNTDLRTLVQQGVEIKTNVEEPLFCYLGDTTHEVFHLHPEILSQHSVIIVECSFFEQNRLERANETMHMHWNHLQPIVQSHPETLFVLIHFSLCYSALKVRTFFHGMQNVHPMLIEQDVEADWQRSLKQPTNGDEEMPTCTCFKCTKS
jgi:ribonuclease Z